MLDKIFKAFRLWMASSERDRVEERFEKTDTKISAFENKVSDRFSYFDDRLDGVERCQCSQNEKLNSIHQVTLANNEALEQKLNSSKVTTEMVRQIVDARINGFQESIKVLQGLIEQVIRRDCNLS